MCGIAGIIKLSSDISLPNTVIKKMTDSISHRGPDDEGFVTIYDAFVECTAGTDTPSQVKESDFRFAPQKDITTLPATNWRAVLGHRRLSIIDVSAAGHQPLCNFAGDLWIVYNGEIYNYKELKNNLLERGYQFRTDTDTEVVLAAYQEWGETMLSKLNGMWAFVIYDKNKNLFFAARDRFGVKPFYYHQDQNYFSFASEQKALMTLPHLSTSINEKAAFEYLVLGKTETEQEGLFRNVIELLPSHSLTIYLDTRSIKINKYYELSYNKTTESFNKKKFQNYLSDIKELIKDSVNARLQSDVPVGSCLSGGLDSASIVCTVQHLTQQISAEKNTFSQKVFTACFKDPAYDESSWANEVVKKTKSAWYKTYPEAQDLIEETENLIYTQDIPFVSTSTFAQYSVMKLIKQENIKVTLDGQGGDELFSGYIPHYSAFIGQAFNSLSFRILLNNIICSKGDFSDAKTMAELIGKKIYFQTAFDQLKNNRYRKLHREYSYIAEPFWEREKEALTIILDSLPLHLNKYLYNQFTGQDIKHLFKTADRNSMKFSVETRMPFADDLKLIEYIFNISSTYKIRKGYSKVLLRESMRDLLPESIANRKDKKGFSTPEANWLKHSKKFYKSYINNNLDHFVNTRELLRDWDLLIDSADNNSARRLWRIINFAIWKQKFSL
ncbi:asparagine synthase [Sporocytophaga myxococcoides]|uniref:asparagine synthase (glutamine-hydrolyzing) n=1 Tax=Sporocytophaga myxococcoides TaxID=153721 RepID=A0A098L8E5_9BACT|nr:asparagine synthase (glutamine-hydrolyzing) [Sporocytophaga myxococcoides]GAL83000.1 asparagine synthase [Sporocytophaga myxococcoides]